MRYLEGERGEKRRDLKLYFPEFRSSFCFLFSYAKEKQVMNTFKSNNQVGGYSFAFSGEDYHDYLGVALSEIADKYFGDVKTKLVVDTAPVLERDLAYRSGLGWFGKNSLLISRHHGSYVMIGSILTDKTYHVRAPKIDTDHCGTCTRCIEACPTDAINEKERSINSYRCIPYFSIELFKDSIKPPDGYETMEEIFGCDICQDVCPWNNKTSNSHKLNDFHLTPKQEKIKNFFIDKNLDEIENELKLVSKKRYKKDWKGTSFERTGRDGMLKNIKWKKKK